MNAFRRLIREAHRRSVWQVLGIYLVGSWVGYQVILNIMEGFGLPGWVAPFALVLFLIGLPIVVATAFIQEGGPERSDFARRDRDAAPAPYDPHHAIPGFATAADELERAADYSSPDPAPAPASVAAPAPRIATTLTWPRALLGGIVAFLVLAVSTAGYMGMRNAGIGPMGTLLGKGELEERDPIVLAQFSSAGGDTALAGAVTEAFRVDFEQSPIVRLVGATQVRDVLRRMQRSEAEGLTPELAREIAEREGYKALLTGEVNAAGGGYVLSARLESVDGRVLASARETAADSTGVLPAIDGLSKALRERIGESLRTIRGNAPLDQVTTASIDALRKYTQSLRARDQGDPMRSLELLEQAVEIDPGFAMAWRKMAAILSAPGMDADRRLHAATRAYELRDRLTEKERHLAAAAYNDWVLGDADAAAREYRSVLDVDPDETTALNNLSLIVAERGDFEEALRLTTRAVEIGGSLVFYDNQADNLYSLGRTEEALEVNRRSRELYPENGLPVFMAGVYLAADGRYEEADSILTDLDAAGRDRSLRAGFIWMQSSLDAVRGRAREALAHARELERESLPLAASEALGSALWRAQLMLVLGRDTATAIRDVDAALERYPIAEMMPLQRPYLLLTGFFVLAGDPERARAYMRERDRAVPAEQRGSQMIPETFVNALLLIEQGDLERAESIIQEMQDRTLCDVCLLDYLAAAHAERGDAQRAIELYERFLAGRYAFRTGEADAAGMPAAIQQLAELYERIGDDDAAARNYARFVELWQDADPELQPRVAEARRRLEGILQRRG